MKFYALVLMGLLVAISLLLVAFPLFVVGYPISQLLTKGSQKRERIIDEPQYTAHLNLSLIHI